MLESLYVWLATGSVGWALFVTGFISSTLFPGGTEGLLVATLSVTTETSRVVTLVLMASLGNTLGAITTLGLGWLLPVRAMKPQAERWIQRWGAPILLLSWLPVVGDALPLAAGWLRLPVGKCIFYLALGKTLRFVALALVVLTSKVFFS